MRREYVYRGRYYGGTQMLRTWVELKPNRKHFKKARFLKALARKVQWC